MPICLPPSDSSVVGLFQHSGINSSDAEVLTLYNVTEAESGEYVCKVSNYIGEANQSAWLTVTRPMAAGKREERHFWGSCLDSRSFQWWKKKNQTLVALLFLLCFWCRKPWKNPLRGLVSSVLCPPSSVPPITSSFSLSLTPCCIN